MHLEEHSKCPLDAPARFWQCLGNIFAIWAEQECASSPRTIMPESRATARSTVFTQKVFQNPPTIPADTAKAC
jgi:hypothetical protein